MPGTLILCAGPIGNLGDAAPRLAEVLGDADIVYAEDTRRAHILLRHLGVRAPLHSYFAGNEADRASELKARLEAGQTVALLTDAGTPAISDPGLSAVRVASSVGAAVTGVPGPSAVTLAAAVSGLPADRFVFEGFLPRRGERRSARLEELTTEARTVILFCAPGRLAGDLADLRDALGADRPCVVCRELTKAHEEVWRGTLGGAAEHWAESPARGEVTLVIGGAAEAPPDMGSALDLVDELVTAGTSPSEACRIVAAEGGIRRRALYEVLMARRRQQEPAEDGSE